MTLNLGHIEAEIKRMESAAQLSTDRKYNRSKKFEFKVQPNWSAMPARKRANVSRRTSMLISWCDKNCQDSYSYDGVKAGFSFVSSKDATLFKLTWG